jgi:hypothetical protein
MAQRTISTIAKELSVERHRVVWLVATHSIPHAAMIGHTRVFDDAAVALIRAEIDRIDAAKAKGVSE